MSIFIISMLVVGALLIAGAIGFGVYCFNSTPSNLRGFYGVRYIVLISLAAIGGIALIAMALI